MEDVKPMEIDLKHYIRRYLEDEFLADMEYKDHLVVVQLDEPYVEKKDNNIYYIEPGADGRINTEKRTTEKRDTRQVDYYTYVPTFYLKESEYGKLNNLTRKIEIRGIASSFDKNVVEKKGTYRTFKYWFKEKTIKEYDTYRFEFPFRECTITPIMETLSFDDYLDLLDKSYYFLSNNPICRLSIVVSDFDRHEGKYIIAEKKIIKEKPDDNTNEDNLENEKCYKVTFNFLSNEEKNKVKNVSVGDEIVIEGLCDTWYFGNCHIVDRPE